MVKIEDYELTSEEEEGAAKSWLKTCDEEDERLKKRIKMLELKKTNRRRFQEKARDFYDGRKEWIKQGVSVARDYEDCNQDTAGKKRALEKVLKSAKVYDEEFLFYFDSTTRKLLELHSLFKIAEFEIDNKEYPSVKAEIKEDVKNKIEKQKKERGKRFAGALEAGAVPAERSLSYALFCQKDGIAEVEMMGRRLDAKLFMLLDCAAKKFLTLIYEDEIKEKQLISPSAFKPNAPALIEIAEQLEALWIEEIENFKKYAVDIPLTLEEVKKITGKNIKNDEFYTMAKQIGEVIINGIVRFYDEDKEVSTKGKHVFSEISNRIKIETPLQLVSPEITTTERKMRGRGANKKEYKVILRFWNRYGLTFLSNVRALKLDLLPKQFYSLSQKAQELFRAIVWKKPSMSFTVAEISRILDLKDAKKTVRIYNRIKTIERICDELYRHWFLDLWEKKGTGRKTRFILFKCGDAKWYLKAKEERKEMSKFYKKTESEIKIRKKQKEDGQWVKELTERFRHRGRF